MRVFLYILALLLVSFYLAEQLCITTKPLYTTKVIAKCFINEKVIENE